jgi:hypothetical protein
MANTLDIIINMIKKGTGDKDAVTGLQKLGTGFKDLTGFSLGAAGGLALVGAGLREGVKLVKDSIGDWVAYNQQIREMTQVTGLGAEEISRIVQVADDWMINIDAVRTSLSFMNKTGVTPSIDNLAILADEYVNTEDKSKFAEKAVKLLGRGYQTLIPILALGGDELRRQTAAIDDNLIATDKSVKETLEYQQTMDNLQDTTTGLKNELAEGLLPALNDVLKGLTEQIDKTGKVNDVSDRLWEAQKKGNLTWAETFVMVTQIKNGFEDTSYAESVLAGITEDTTEAVYDERREVIALSQATYEAVEGVDGLTESTKKFDLEAMLAEQAADKFKQKIDDLNISIDSALGPTIEDFNITQGELTTELEETQAEIDRLIAEGYDPMSEEVLGLKGDYEELKGQYTTNEQEHDRATKEIMFDMLEQEAAIGGLTDAEGEMLQLLAEKWGLPYQATLDYMEKEKEALTYLEESGDAEGAILILEGQQSAWGLTRQAALLARDGAAAYKGVLDSLSDKVIHITTYHEDTFAQHNFQSGANFIVPPGYENDTYRMGVSSGEHVIVEPTNNFTMNVHTNAPSSTVMRDFQFMRALAG